MLPPNMDNRERPTTPNAEEQAVAQEAALRERLETVQLLQSNALGQIGALLAELQKSNDDLQRKLFAMERRHDDLLQRIAQPPAQAAAAAPPPHPGAVNDLPHLLLALLAGPDPERDEAIPLFLRELEGDLRDLISLRLAQYRGMPLQ